MIGARYNQVRRSFCPCGAALAHRLAYHLATAEDCFVTGPPGASAKVFGYLYKQVGVRQPHPVPGGGAIQQGVARAGQLRQWCPSPRRGNQRRNEPQQN